MNHDDEKRIAAKLAKTMATLCVRNTHLETIHAGKVRPFALAPITVAAGPRAFWLGLRPRKSLDI